MGARDGESRGVGRIGGWVGVRLKGDQRSRLAFFKPV